MGKDLKNRLDDVYQNYLEGNISRRDFVKFAGIAGATLGLAGGPFGLVRNAFASKSITVHSWGGTTSEALRKFAFDPFTKATGIEVIDAAFTGMDDFLTQVKASFPPGGEFNIAHLSAVYDYARYTDLDFGVVLDESKIPNLKNVMTKMTDTLRGITNGTLSAVPYDLGQTGIAYNTNEISKADAEKLGASLLYEKSLKGKLGSWGGDFRTNMWYAALHTGQSPNNITDIDAVWDALTQQRSLMKKYWASGSELMSLLANGEIFATVAWSGRVAALQDQGHPIGYLSPDGTYSWMEYMYVIKGTDLDVAQQLLNFMLEPDAAIAVAQGQKYPPALDPTKVEMPDDVKKLPAFDPTGKLNGYLFADPAYWNKHQIEWAEKWDRIIAGA
ncbi:extracellular solute-binding protein [Desulfotignum phosphitoxidans]|uniref:ABC-type spermidine/putrescine transport system, periplasmic substrate-binding component PotD n=1 Tax=Desulfotignum phosphitoxidans DSM 13687 TaxID=1286635 RepID=S0G2A6_9BACT|nr:extracellular solute-binding protein [Desulfotignum phosphitoxidans]EMS78277.1 ABC-type spermidine/putrescine transport system, periplasmic substrate-binding component PotD [Desulfotignum phosphitoxidans DSM 13687]